MSVPVTSYRLKCWRIISTRYPPVDVFDSIASPEDFDALHQLEARTNDRLRQETGAISLLAPQECVYGQGAGYIMAAFTHLNPEGSRFSDGSYGIYYAADTVKTAIEETKYHRALFLARTHEAPQELDMRVLTAILAARFHDITGRMKALPDIYRSDDYSRSQPWGKSLRKDGASGIAYDSVRYAGGTCFAAFRPKSLSRCTQAQHLRYFWDGKSIAHVAELRDVA